MASIMVISPDWRTRALLAAQICESCDCDTVSAPGIDEALTLLSLVPVRPVLVVIDTGQAQGEIGPAEIERLRLRLPEVPFVLVTSAFQRASLASSERYCAACLTRPVSIGAIAETVKRLLGEKASGQT